MKKLALFTLLAISMFAAVRTTQINPLPTCGAPGADPCPYVR